MDRRSFLTGLFGVASLVALAGVATHPAQAAPIARAMRLPELPDADGGRTPDGTEIDKVQARRRHWSRGRRGPPSWARRWRRRRSRLVCRTTRWRGRLVRRCRRVWW